MPSPGQAARRVGSHTGTSPPQTHFGVRGLVRAFGRRLVAVACRGAPGTPRAAERGSAWPASRPGAKSGDESPHSKSSASRVISGMLLNRYCWPPLASLSLNSPARASLPFQRFRPRPEPSQRPGRVPRHAEVASGAPPFPPALRVPRSKAGEDASAPTSGEFECPGAQREAGRGFGGVRFLGEWVGAWRKRAALR